MGGDIRCADYAAPGTEAVGTNAIPALKDRGGCTLANHGVLAVGKDLAQAYLRAEYIEDVARIYYPDFAAKGCKAVQNGSCALVILCCGTGVGMSMCANKMKGIRACCCSDTFSAEFTRRHNNANALCLGGRVVGAGLGCQIVDAFLNAEFEGGRHQMRIDKMMALENH